MNPVEIEEAVSQLAVDPFDRVEFPFRFLRAFGHKDAAIARLRAGNTNQSDICGAVLQRGHIHIAACAPGAVDETLKALRESSGTIAQNVKFILATDGEVFQAEDMSGGGAVACSYAALPDHFGFFLPLAGITTVKQIREGASDIKATGRLNKLYVALLKDNPDWATRPHDMNHFMARLIFCFFAEDMDIFPGERLFSKTIERMSARDASDTQLVMAEIFRAMDTRPADREAAGIRRHANQFPYVNAQLFSGATECPRFSRIARSHLLHIGRLDWRKINPDIFGSMIQAIADDEERGAIGMHYTSVPNILKALNPLFLDDLRGHLQEAGDNPRKLLTLRQRMAKIRVFDPACGSGNFLIVAYKEMRAIEAEINRRCGEPDRRSDIPLTNFRGIELRDFPAELARLALIIAAYQCDLLYCGRKEALAGFLPLDGPNWIACGNALRLDWLSICPPTEAGVQARGDDPVETTPARVEIDFENEGEAETYICGNPPYLGSREQATEHKEDLKRIFADLTPAYKVLDYVAGWFLKASDFINATQAQAAFVTTNSISQGQQVPLLWPLLMKRGVEISFAHTSFKWRNLASNNAGVIVVIIGLGRAGLENKRLFFEGPDGALRSRTVENINGYLAGAENTTLEARGAPISELSPMQKGNYPVDGGFLLLSREEARRIRISPDLKYKILRRFTGSSELIRGTLRYCLWIDDDLAAEAWQEPDVAKRLRGVEAMRLESRKEATQRAASTPHRFYEIRQSGDEQRIVAIPVHSSENRDWIPFDLLSKKTIVYGSAFAIFDAPDWNMAVLASRLHHVWIATVCGRIKTDFRYSNTLGWNTFPLAALTDQNKADLARCAADILLAREAHFPATIADLYDPETMPEDLRAAHERNDAVLEHIYIGRRFRNDSERLEKLFELYARMTAKSGSETGKTKAA